MNQLGDIFFQLSPREITVLKKSLSGKPKLRELFDTIRRYPGEKDLFYSEKIGYGSESKAFLTLKHRFLDFVVKGVFTQTGNPLDEIRTRITQLSLNIYSGNDQLQKMELKRLLKVAFRMDDPVVIQQLLKIKLVFLTRELAGKAEIQEARRQYAYYTEMRNKLETTETDFFHHAFFVNSSMFHKNAPNAIVTRQKFESILSAYPKNSIFQFLCQIIFLELEIRGTNLNQTDFLERVEEMEKIFKNSVLRFKYPHIDIGFAVMRSKCYFLNQDFSGFCEHLRIGEEHFSQIYQKPMFPCVQIYFRFALFFVHSRRALSDEEIDVYLKKYGVSGQPMVQCALFFFKACRAFNEDDINSATKLISKARQLFDKNMRHHSTLPLEAALLGLFCQVMTDKPKPSLIQYEINALKYAFRISILKESSSLKALIRKAQKAINLGDLPGFRSEISVLIRELAKDRLMLILNKTK